MFDCLGIHALGQCAYNPASPPSLYFSIGEAVAALSITLLIPQFLKPIYLFRLNTQRVRPAYIYAAVFAAGTMVLVAALVPQLGLAGLPLVGYPVFWELAAGLLFFVAFGALAWPTFMTARARRGHIKRFAQATADFLAHADDSQRSDFATDLLRNTKRLAEAANFAGLHRRTSAFFDFIHSKKLQDGAYAEGLFRLFAEEQFCATLVSKRPWDAAGILRVLADHPVGGHRSSSTTFVQELARQAILCPASMMGREIGYTGFVTAPVLSQALFNDEAINWHYHPLRGMRFFDIGGVSSEVCLRYFHALHDQLLIVLEREDYWNDRSLRMVSDQLRWLAHDVNRQVRQDRGKYDVVSELQHGLERVIETTREHLLELDPHLYEQLFLSETDNHTVLDELADAVVETFNAFANDFAVEADGWDDPFWIPAIQLLGKVFGRHGDLPDGVDPLQQRIAQKLIEKVQENMRGLYPILTRVLIRTIGPYRQGPEINARSAFGLLREAFYREMKNLPDLHSSNPEHASRLIPRGARLDAASSTLAHQYRGGEEDVTDLNALDIPPVSFTDAATRRRLGD